VRIQGSLWKYRIPIVAVVVVAVITVALLQSGILSAGEYELTVARCTIVLTSHSILGDRTNTNVVAAPYLIGKYPVGKQLVISYQLTNTAGTGAMKLTRVEATTSGFTFAMASPTLPITAPIVGSIEVKLTFDTPRSAYKGPLDYTIYYDLTM